MEPLPEQSNVRQSAVAYAWQFERQLWNQAEAVTGVGRSQNSMKERKGMGSIARCDAVPKAKEAR
jgi:hypothetical protein